jgi:dienelactone hydrolase
MSAALLLSLWLGAVGGGGGIGGTTAATNGGPNGGAESAAKAVADSLVKRDYAAIVARFDATMAAALPVDKLKATWEPLASTSGKLLRLDAPHARPVGGFVVVVVPLVYEHATWDLKVTFNGERKVSGLFVTPAAAADGSGPPWEPPLYGRAPVLEAPIKVGPAQLPGVLTLPWGKGPFPAAVLVHGSGPQDADETIGPNKPFRDLALGLAGRGIACIRYEKRTRARPGEFAVNRKATVKEETVDDAIAAVRLAVGAPAIDGRRVWVIGHSLGGYLAPRIAAAAPEVAGIAILAGPTRPLEELIVEQMRTLHGVGSPVVAQAEKLAHAVRDPKLTEAAAVDVLGTQIAGAYFLDLRRYDAGRVAAGLRVPILVLQGERDFQVRRADYDGWAAALGGHPNAHLALYPGLNHLLEAGQGESRPVEYERPGLHVDPQVVEDLAAFILHPPTAGPNAPGH